MTANDPSQEPQETHSVYSIEAVEEITSTPRHQIAVYCRYGLVATVGEPESSGWTFDDEAIRKVRQLEFLRAQYGMNLTGLRAMAELLHDVERLQEEVRFLRGRS
jgi:hypothetical protein